MRTCAEVLVNSPTHQITKKSMNFVSKTSHVCFAYVILAFNELILMS